VPCVVLMCGSGLLLSRYLQGCVWWLECPDLVWISVEECGGRAALLRWMSGAVLFRGGAGDGLNDVQCCSGAAVGVVSPVTGCEVRSTTVVLQFCFENL
jgi:hypothetical protein